MELVIYIVIVNVVLGHVSSTQLSENSTLSNAADSEKRNDMVNNVTSATTNTQPEIKNVINEQTMSDITADVGFSKLKVDMASEWTQIKSKEDLLDAPTLPFEIKTSVIENLDNDTNNVTSFVLQELERIAKARPQSYEQIQSIYSQWRAINWTYELAVARGDVLFDRLEKEFNITIPRWDGVYRYDKYEPIDTRKYEGKSWLRRKEL